MVTDHKETATAPASEEQLAAWRRSEERSEALWRETSARAGDEQYLRSLNRTRVEYDLPPLTVEILSKPRTPLPPPEIRGQQDQSRVAQGGPQ